MCSRRRESRLWKTAGSTDDGRKETLELYRSSRLDGEDGGIRTLRLACVQPAMGKYTSEDSREHRRRPKRDVGTLPVE